MKKLVLIDGNSLLNRAFYATPVFTTSGGMPTNAIFGFVKLLFKIQSDLKPEYLVVAFDMKAPTFRHKMFEGYKATRKSMPDELAVQVEPLKNLLHAMKIATCQKEGIEADDILGTLSKKFNNVHSYVYTGDRDSYQLVDEHTDVYFTKRGVSDLLKLSIENFKSEVGLEPSQIIDLKSLMGDKSDNIPGVPGIGEKTALSLIENYGNLDGIFEHIDEIKGATLNKLNANKELAYLSYKLATIDRDCVIQIDLENCVCPKKYGYEVRKLFGEFEFKSFIGLNIFEEEGTNAVSSDMSYPEKIICKSYSDVKDVLQRNREFTIILKIDSAEIYVEEKEYLIELSNDLLAVDNINYDDFTQILREIFLKPENKILCYDCKKLMHELDNLGIDFCCDFDDLSLVNYICDYDLSVMNLSDLIVYHNYDLKFSAYAINKLFSSSFSRLQSEELTSLYYDIEKPLVAVLYSMEREGVKVSVNMLDELSKQFRERSENLRFKIYELCGCEFNLNSPMQLGDVLYNKLGITEVKKKKTDKYTTSADVLEKLTDKSPVIGYILKYRFYQKLNSTYLDGFRPLIDKKSGLVHTTFHQTATTTGRLSSSNPNLQNIPIRDAEGKDLRKVFIAREGNVFIDADYSQIELRLLAHFSQCKELVEAYQTGTDIHSVTASQVFDVPLEEVTDKMRREAKAVNFGIIYGISDFGLARNLNISNSKAKEYIEKYFATYSSVKDYMSANVAFAKQHGYVSTLTGRKRVIPELNSNNYNLRQFGERAAMNMPLQGSSADIIKIAMINTFKALKAEGLKAKLILQVHDELVIEAPECESARVAEILKECMEHAVHLIVPLTVDVHIGKNWYDAK